MTDLTEQWKKGELKQGEYWCKITESPYIERVYLPCCDDIIVEVLAPVPSYEEWRRTFHYAGKYEHEYTSCVMEYENLKQENQQLKELLRECKPYVTRNVVFTTVNRAEVVDLEKNELLTKIDNAIGENK